MPYRFAQEAQVFSTSLEVAPSPMNRLLYRSTKTLTGMRPESTTCCDAYCPATNGALITRPFPVSATNRFRAASTATSSGLLKPVATTSSAPYPPATTGISITRLFPVSATNTFPSESTASPEGLFKPDTSCFGEPYPSLDIGTSTTRLLPESERKRLP